MWGVIAILCRERNFMREKRGELWYYSGVIRLVFEVRMPRKIMSGVRVCKLLILLGL